MLIGVLNIDDHKITVSSKKNVDDGQCPIIANIHSRFDSLHKTHKHVCDINAQVCFHL